ncbi:DUF4037 domain-containing protein [Candidatus Bathyarchaeota archaeon]|nr:DUF4037 domain-containing protein [Candidatus Bathyarchaeota archaeon]
MRFFKDTYGISKRGNRPHGRLPDDSQLDEMLDSAYEYVEFLSEYDEVTGITLGGGLSRGYGDNLSEIDLNIYLNEEEVNRWILGKGPIPQGDHMGRKYHMDVSFLNIEKERRSNWNLLKKWDASYAKILYDPLKKVQELLEEKDVFTAEEKHSLALRNYLDCTYFGEIVVRQWILRGDPVAANQLINRGIPALVNLLFLANDEYPPFEKWLINYSHSLPWKPQSWKEHIKDLIEVKTSNFNELKLRSSKFMDLYHQIWAKIVGDEYSHTGLLELDALEAMQYVVDNEPTLEEFKEKYSLEQLSYENLYKLAEIKEEGGETIIKFDREKYEKERQKGFPNFLGWNREMLTHLNL